MNKTIFVTAAVLFIGLSATPAAAEKKSGPPAGPATTGVGLNPNLIQTPFRVWPDQNYIFVVNGGTKDWTAALDVTAKCTPVAPSTSCGSNFPGGIFRKHYNAGTFPKGFGQSPVSAPNGNSVIIPNGAGYDAVFMGLPVGTYRITATAANNSSPDTAITITTPPPGAPAPVHVNPAATLGVRPKNP